MSCMDAGTERVVLKLKGNFGAEHGDKLSYLKGHKKEINDQCDSLSPLVWSKENMTQWLASVVLDPYGTLISSRPSWTGFRPTLDTN